jgi:hypothetical protein
MTTFTFYRRLPLRQGPSFALAKSCGLGRGATLVGLPSWTQLPLDCGGSQPACAPPRSQWAPVIPRFQSIFALTGLLYLGLYFYPIQPQRSNQPCDVVCEICRSPEGSEL